MKKILSVSFVLALVIVGAVFWHRSRYYAVGFFMPSDKGGTIQNSVLFRGLYHAWNLGIDRAGATGLFEQCVFDIPADIAESIPVLKERVKYFLKKHNRLLWQDEKMLIVAAFTSGQLQAAQEAVHEEGRKVVCVSATSTTPRAASWRNVLQMMHNDNFAGQAIAMFVRRKQCDRAAILYIEGDVYSQGYREELTKSFEQQEVDCRSFAFDPDSILAVVDQQVNPYLHDAKKPVLIFTGEVREIMKAEKFLASHVNLICTDMCSEMGDVFAPHRGATIVVPAIVDYTITTRAVYKKVFDALVLQDSSFDYICSFGVPFMYDFACQVGNMIVRRFDLTWHYFQVKIEASEPGAALDSTWYTPRRNGPAHGGYWFIYTHDPKTKNIASYRKVLLGNTSTLPQSAAVAYQIGYYSWAGLLGWNMYQNIWEDYYQQGQFLATKLSYDNYQDSGGIINWAPFHVKKYQDNKGKWWFAGDVPDQYPLVARRYELV